MGKKFSIVVILLAGIFFIGFGLTPAYAQCTITDPASDDLGLTDDTTTDVSGVVPAGFNFRFFGKKYPTDGGIFVNSNGSVTFGAGDTDSSESIGEFVDGLPRIAPFWDDLDPADAGSVHAEFVNNRLRVTWLGVAENGTVNSNTAQLTMERSGKFEWCYDGVALDDALVGITPGPAGEVDLSSSKKRRGRGDGWFELFTGGGGQRTLILTARE